MQKLASEVERLVRASRGRAFVLCTSTRRVRQLFDRLERLVGELAAGRQPAPYTDADLHRFELLKALHFPLPATPQEKRALWARLAAWCTTPISVPCKNWPTMWRSKIRR